MNSNRFRLARAAALLLLRIGVAGCGGAAPGGSGSGLPAALLGTWRTGTVSDTNFYDSGSGSFGSPSGTGLFYRLGEDGSYQFGLLETSTNGSCTLTAFIFVEGSVRVDGSALAFTPRAGKSRQLSLCGAYHDEQDPLTPAQLTPLEYSWQLGADQYGPTLTLSASTGESGTLRRVQP